MKSLLLLFLIGASSLFLGGCSEVDAAFGKGKSANTSQEKIQIEPLTESEKLDLLFLREEEKLAHDVYQTLEEKWGAKTFSNIKGSESLHTSQVAQLLIQYNISYSAVEMQVGVFQNTDLQKLYIDLVSKGSISLEEAMKVGAFIEEYDIKDIRQKLLNTTNSSILLLYKRLENGSENHLRAFSKNIDNYIPQILSQEEYDEIIAGQNVNKGNKGINKYNDDNDDENRNGKGKGNENH